MCLRMTVADTLPITSPSLLAGSPRPYFLWWTKATVADLRANKLTCLLSRAEPRDLVDLLFLDRAGYPPEDDLALALKKDTGIDQGVLSWLLGEYPVEPLPEMLLPLTSSELRVFRDELRERFRRLAVPAT
jgi:hypothetical protein